MPPPAESPPPAAPRRGPAPSEAALQHGWATAPPVWLRDAAGGAWRVLFAGTWNHGPGPDFRDALLLPPWGAPLRGDVEIHCEAAAWGRHGHHQDPAYAGVMLHLCGRLPAEAARADGPLSLRGPRRRAVYAAGVAASAPPCVGLVARAGPTAVAGALDRLGRERLQAKALRLARLRARCGAEATADATSDDVAYAALLAALGQGGSETAFTKIADGLPWRALRRDAARGDAPALRRRLQAALPEPPVAGSPSWRGRPANAPRRRLDALAALLARFTAAGGSDVAASESGPSARGQPGGLARGLVALAALPEAEALRALRLPGLLGPARARQVLVDAVYPLALSLGGGDELVRHWLALGGARYGRTQPLRERLQAGGLRSWRNGATQALLSLERCYCRAGACAVCPLARLAQLRPSRGPRPSPNAEFGASAPITAHAGAAQASLVEPAPAWKTPGPEVENRSNDSVGSAPRR